MSSQDKGGRPNYSLWSGETAEGPDILKQGSDRPPTRWRSAVRWRRPPTIGIILGVAGLLVGLAAGYAGGTLHAEKATAPSAQSGATALPSPVPIGGASSVFQPRCSAPAGATGRLKWVHISITGVSLPRTADGKVIAIVPPSCLS